MIKINNRNFNILYYNTNNQFKMSFQIIPSQQLLLISASDNKQHLLFDPKTTSVLQKFQDQHEMGTQATYYQNSKQFIMSNHNRSFISVWQIGVQCPVTKMSLSETITFMVHEDGFLYGGSINGNLYIWQLPSGLLLRKIVSFSSEIKFIQPLNNGTIITLSKNQIKLWTLHSLFIEQTNCLPTASTHLPTTLISSKIERNLLFTVHQSTLCVYCTHSLSLKQVIELSGGLSQCFALSRTSVYIATNQCLINQYSIAQKEIQLQYQTDKLLIRQNKKNKIIQTKNIITSLVFVRSLALLVSGSIIGEITIWQNQHQKRSMQLFKTPIKHISILPRSNNHDKIYTSNKIKPLHKYQNSNQQQPLLINRSIEKPIQLSQQTQNQIILTEMMHEMMQPYDIMKQQIECLRKQRDQLLQKNIKYVEILTGNVNQ